MTKREMIDQITHLNPTARPAFLAEFGDRDLAEYLEHLKWLCPPPAWSRAGRPARGTSSADCAPVELAAADSPANKVADQPDRPTEPLAAAASEAGHPRSPFAKKDSEEDSQTWLF